MDSHRTRTEKYWLNVQQCWTVAVFLVGRWLIISMFNTVCIERILFYSNHNILRCVVWAWGNKSTLCFTITWGDRTVKLVYKRYMKMERTWSSGLIYGVPFLAVYLLLDVRTSNKKWPCCSLIMKSKSLVKLASDPNTDQVKEAGEIFHRWENCSPTSMSYSYHRSFYWSQFFPVNLLLYKFYLFLTGYIILSRINELVWC